MVNNTNIILVLQLTFLDANELGSLFEGNLYEYELLKAVQAWRKNAGWLANIDIICYVNNINKLSKNILYRLENLNVKFVQLSNLDPFFSRYRFYYLEHAEQYAKNNKIDFIINIDLDVYLLKPLPKFLFNKYKYLTACHYDQAYILDIFKQSNGFRLNAKDIDLNRRFFYNVKNHNQKTINKLTEELLTIHNVNYNSCSLIKNIAFSNEYNKYFKKNINDVFYFSESLYDYVFLNKLKQTDFNFINLKYLLDKFLIHKHIRNINDYINIKI